VGVRRLDLVFSGGWADPELPVVLYCVATNGDVLWYGDRLGMGYEPRSGCRIGSEWEFRGCD
jgi:hypothetical protein